VSNALPDFRNLGIMARVLIAANALVLGAVLAANADGRAAFEAFVHAAALLEPLLMASIIALYLASPWLARLPYWAGAAAVVALVLGLAAAAHLLLAPLAQPPGASLARTLALAGAATLVLLGYLRLHAKAHSPALAEARLQALQSRIRPHFLFNSLNAVLALVRRDPRRAEQTLEDLADLFRALMSDARGLVRLSEEIALLERYASIEKLRLGERMRISWELDGAPMDALLPALVLQPLLENAVYHGVEPALGTADVTVRIERRDDRVLARIENPFFEDERARRPGNRMALDNIRERLMLFFDAEARLESQVRNGRYAVEIEIPYRSGAR
jgi:two-component system sensor histidine kinase AlgZ